jgi:four helix bundle protein
VNTQRPTERPFSTTPANAERTARPSRPGDDIAAAVVKLLPTLADQPGARTIVRQLERCGPAGGSNYEEARGAESPGDFVHKVRIALKEVRETRYWLKLALRAELTAEPIRLGPLIQEAEELIAILTASANTARRRM